MPRERVVTGEGARFKGLALRGREAGDGGRQRGDRGGDVRSSHILHHSQ